jgi:hypothetical protein
VVVFPQAPELSTSRQQIGRNCTQADPQEKSLQTVDQKTGFHTSTTPYYN